jgi:hypothetical protein
VPPPENGAFVKLKWSKRPEIAAELCSVNQCHREALWPSAKVSYFRNDILSSPNRADI